MDPELTYEDELFADDYEDVYEDVDGFGELEGDIEAGDFFGLDAEVDEFGFLKKAWRGIKRVGRKLAPIAKRLAPVAGKVIGGAFGGPAGAMIGGGLGSLIGNLEAEELEGFEQYEEFEDDADTEDEMNAESFMEFAGDDEDLAEYMADMAARAPNPTDAKAMAGAITITIASKAPLQVRALTPTLSSAAARVATVMKRSPASKPLVKVVPTITKKTIATLAKKAAKGKTVTPRTAKRVMAKHAVRVLSNSRELTKALAKNEAKRRKVNMKAVKRAESFA